MSLMAAVLAIGASASYGVGDTLALLAVRRFTASSVALWVQTLGLVLLAIATAAVQPDWSSAAVVWGLGAGVLAAAGVLAFYTAVQNGEASAVVPISSTGIVIPLVGGLFAGDMLSTAALAGAIVLIIGALMIARSGTSNGAVDPDRRIVATPGRSHPTPAHDGCKPLAFARPRTAATLLAVVAAACFGTFYLVVQHATSVDAAGTADEDLGRTFLVALAVQFGALVVTAWAASRHTVRCMMPNSSLLGVAAVIAVLDVAGDLLVTGALAVGPVAVVGPLGSLDPLFAVVIAALFLRESMGKLRIVGVLACVAGIVLIAV